MVTRAVDNRLVPNVITSQQAVKPAASVMPNNTKQTTAPKSDFTKSNFNHPQKEGGPSAKQNQNTANSTQSA
jgi:hypothetical protein